MNAVLIRPRRVAHKRLFATIVEVHVLGDESVARHATMVAAVVEQPHAARIRELSIEDVERAFELREHVLRSPIVALAILEELHCMLVVVIQRLSSASRG